MEPNKHRPRPWRAIRRIVLGAALCLAAGCGTEPPPPPPAAAEPPPLEALPPLEPLIPIDDALAGEEASLARNIYFILDGSGSMSRRTGFACRGDQRFRNRLQGAQWAVRQFLAKVPDEVHIGLYLFDARGRRQVVPLGTGNRGEFLNAVDGIWAGGGTPLADAIVLATDELVAQYQHQLGYGEYRLVVVTDGQADKIPQAAAYAERFGMPIYAIGLCIEEDHPLRRHAVSYRAADSFEDLAQGLEETLAELPSFDATEFVPEQDR